MTVRLRVPYHDVPAAALWLHYTSSKQKRVIFCDGSVAQKAEDGSWYTMLGAAGKPGEAAEFVAEVNTARENRYGKLQSSRS